MIIIRMYLNTYADRFNLISDGPATSPTSGSTTSTVSVSSGVSASAGFFGATGTGNVDVSASKGTSNSHSVSLQDFTVINTSTDKAVEHKYLLSMVEGVKYAHRSDLIKDHANGTLYEPPLLATSNFPIISQAIWQTKRGPNGEYLQVNDNVEIKIEFHQYLSAVGAAPHVNRTVGGAFEGAGRGIANLVGNFFTDGSIKIDPDASVVYAWEFEYSHANVKQVWPQSLNLANLDATVLTPVTPQIWT